MQRALVILTVLGCLSLSWILSRLGEDYLCNESRVVKTIITVAVDENNTEYFQRLPGCGILNKFMHQSVAQSVYGSSSAAEALLIKDAVQRVSSWGAFWSVVVGGPTKPLNLIIDFTEPFRWELHGKTLVLGAEMARTKGVLERSLYQAKISHLKGGGELLWRSLLSDWLYAFQMGEWSWGDPASGQLLSIQDYHWASYLKDYATYCVSPERALDHRLECEAEKATSPERYYLWSLRPFFSKSVWKELKGLEHADLFSVLSEWIVRTAEGDSPGRILRWTNSVSDSIENTELWVNSVQAGFSQELNRFKLNHESQSESGSENAPEVESAKTFDLLVFVPKDSDLKSEMFEALFQQAPDNKRVLVSWKDQGVLVLPGRTPLQQGIPKQWTFSSILWVDCKVPNVETMWEFQRHSSRVSFVKRCAGDLPLDWEWLVDSGFEKMASFNKDLEYVSYYLPSLKTAVEHQGYPQPVVANFWSQSWRQSWGHWLGWEAVEWDERLQAYRPLAHYQGITAFRYQELNPSQKDLDLHESE